MFITLSKIIPNRKENRQLPEVEQISLGDLPYYAS